MSAAVIDIHELLEVPSDSMDGRPRLKGTGITVHRIAALHMHHESPGDILDAFPEATLAGIHAALAYYYAHTTEVEADLARDVDDAAREALAAGVEII